MPPIRQEKSLVLEPMKKEPGVFSTLESVLRNPGSILYHLTHDSPGKLILSLLGAAGVCLLIFGFVVGTFSMGTQLWAAPLKILAGLFFAGLICLPSLYIFSCLCGLEVRFATVAGLLASMICLASLLLVGFAPVVWIFSQSTESVAFVGFLNLIIWIIAVWFGLGLVGKAARALGGRDIGHLRVWMVIFLLVTFQLTTSLRPIIGESDDLLTSKKKFFLEHWVDTMNGKSK